MVNPMNLSFCVTRAIFRRLEIELQATRSMDQTPTLTPDSRPDIRGRVRAGSQPWTLKRCNHRVIILCDGTINSHRMQSSKSMAQWKHLSFAIFAIFDQKRQLKLLEMACDQFLTCLIFPLRWASFPIKSSRKAQWEHLFLMYFDDFMTICLIS